MQPQSSQAQFQEDASQNQPSDDFVRQRYSVTHSAGQSFILPTVLEKEETAHPLAKMVKPDVDTALKMPGGPGVTQKKFNTLMSDGFVEYRADPGHSEREHSLLHAEVKALQQSLSISYKDTAHRLYMAELEQIKKADSAAKSFAAIRQSLDSLVAVNILSPIVGIDSGQVDGLVFEDGVWREEGRKE